MLTVERNSEDCKLILTALVAMGLRHAEWYKLEADKRNCDHEKLRYHSAMKSKYESLHRRMTDAD